MIVGRIGKDAEQRNTQAGKTVTSFSVATSEKYTNQAGEKVESTQWHRCVAWGKVAEITGDYAKKGQLVACRGKMTYRKYTDNNGQERDIAEIVVDDFMMLSSKSSNQQAEQSQPVQQVKQPTPAQANGYDDTAGRADDDDLPDDLPF
jgi:single-strand DNA-binding protein